jgi:hypothetical protein
MESNRTVIDNKKIIAMKELYKDASKVKYSSLVSAPDCESVNGNRKQFDFSKFNEFFNGEVYPGDLVEYLHEMRAAYLELYICVYKEYVQGNSDMSLPDNIHDHVFYLSKLIELIKELQP